MPAATPERSADPCAPAATSTLTSVPSTVKVCGAAPRCPRSGCRQVHLHTCGSVGEVVHLDGGGRRERRTSPRASEAPAPQAIPPKVNDSVMMIDTVRSIARSALLVRPPSAYGPGLRAPVTSSLRWRHGRGRFHPTAGRCPPCGVLVRGGADRRPDHVGGRRRAGGARRGARDPVDQAGVQAVGARPGDPVHGPHHARGHATRRARSSRCAPRPCGPTRPTRRPVGGRRVRVPAAGAGGRASSSRGTGVARGQRGGRFPSGLGPLDARLQEIRDVAAAGRRRDRHRAEPLAFLAGHYGEAFDEIAAAREAARVRRT